VPRKGVIQNSFIVFYLDAAKNAGFEKIGKETSKKNIYLIVYGNKRNLKIFNIPIIY